MQIVESRSPPVLPVLLPPPALDTLSSILCLCDSLSQLGFPACTWAEAPPSSAGHLGKLRKSCQKIMPPTRKAQTKGLTTSSVCEDVGTWGSRESLVARVGQVLRNTHLPYDLDFHSCIHTQEQRA